MTGLISLRKPTSWTRSEWPQKLAWLECLNSKTSIIVSGKGSLTFCGWDKVLSFARFTQSNSKRTTTKNDKLQNRLLMFLQFLRLNKLLTILGGPWASDCIQSMEWCCDNPFAPLSQRTMHTYFLEKDSINYGAALQ